MRHARNNNPFALVRSDADHSYVSFLRKWRDNAWDRYNSVLADLCERNMEMAQAYGLGWAWLSDGERAAMDDTLLRLYREEERAKTLFMQAVEKYTAYMARPPSAVNTSSGECPESFR